MKNRGLWICCLLIAILVLLCGWGMGLRMPFLVLALALSLPHALRLVRHHEKASFEALRFREANGYMAQVAQVFADDGKLLLALRETRATFPAGNMRRRLTEAIAHIEQAYDAELAEREGLDMIRGDYDCERIRTLHEFLLDAERRGGSCATEFALLEKQRQIWEKSELQYRKTAVMSRNLVAVEYLLLMSVCMFMLRQLPADLQIMQMTFIQVLDALLIACFFLVFCAMDKHCCKGMLENPKRMGKAAVKRKWERVHEYQKAVGPLGHLRAGGTLPYVLALQSLRKEVRAVFPCWLFDVLLLMQSENVVVSLARSRAQAPEVLQDALYRLQQGLSFQSDDPETFLGFLAELKMPEVEDMMRKLYAISVGHSAQMEAMELIIDQNVTLLSDAETQRMRMRGDLYSVCNLLPAIPVMACMVGYGIALMVIIFRTVMDVI